MNNKLELEYLRYLAWELVQLSQQAEQVIDKLQEQLEENDDTQQ